ncbi:MAG: nucleotidyltransferase family protein [Hyphomicrobiales bacterium]
MIAGILLAAGASRRFGIEDKLLAEFAGAPLVTHAAGTLRKLDPDILIAVTRSPEVAAALPGYTVVAPSKNETLQADSLRAGILEAQRRQASHALVMLGDMPFVEESHLKQLLNRCTEIGASATTDGKRKTPPACFSRALFPRLLQLNGDKGAASMLRELPEDAFVAECGGKLIDVDTPTDLDLVNGQKN